MKRARSRKNAAGCVESPSRSSSRSLSGNSSEAGAGDGGDLCERTVWWRPAGLSHSFLSQPLAHWFATQVDGDALVQLDGALELAGAALAAMHPGLTLAEPSLGGPISTPRRVLAEDLLSLMVALRMAVASYAREVEREH